LAIETGRAIADARRAIGWSQRDLATRAMVPQSAISRLERGRRSAIDLTTIERIAGRLGARMSLVFDAPFLNDRRAQRDRVHARCIGYAASRLRRAGWLVMSEVEIDGAFGPGWIDILAFHQQAAVLLVVEVKTEIRDLGRIQRTLAWYERRAPAAARRAGWWPRRTHATLLLLATDAVDGALRDNRVIAAEAFTGRARQLASFVAGPGDGPPPGRSLAMIDPLSRRQAWIRPTRLDGRRTPAPYADYAAAVRGMSRRP
jgi:transcriptional regulator with XRE-family HTH domain